jgi:hypothetical protein
VALGGGFILLGLGGPPLLGQGAKLPQKHAPAEKHAAAPSPGKIWKSETTGKEYRVRIEKDRFYAEWVAPPDAAKQGAYIRSECRRTGTKWIGTSQVFVLCPKPGDVNGKSTNGCSLTFRFEVDSITPERITGSGETIREIDCAKCEVRQTGWGNFVWVPKGKGARLAGSSPGTSSNKSNKK